MSAITLFDPTATSFDTLGAGVLADAIKCEVTEELNGEYEVEMEYPVNGIHYNNIHLRSIIVCETNPSGERQPFRIYQINQPINGIATIYARHISYDLSGYPVWPFATNKGLDEALKLLKENSKEECPFEFSSDFSGTESGNAPEGTFAVDAPSSIKSWMGGRDGSLLDVFGGEWVFDKFSCKLADRRGTDRGVHIYYGSNLKSMDWVDNEEESYTGVWGYYSYVFTKNKEQTDAAPFYVAAHVEEATAYYAAGSSKTTPPDDSEFVSKEDWEEDNEKKVSVTKDKPYLWAYISATKANETVVTKGKVLIGHYGWTTVDETESQIDDFEVEYDEFGNSLVPYEHTVRTTGIEYYAVSDSKDTAPPEKDDKGNDNWRTSLPGYSDKKPYLWVRFVTKREAKKEMIIFSDVIPTAAPDKSYESVSSDYTKILTADLSEEFEAPPAKEQLNSFIRKYIATNKLAEMGLNITLDFVQIQDIPMPVYLGDTMHVVFNDAKKTIRCNRVVWDVLKGRYSAIEVGYSQYAGMATALSKYSSGSGSGSKYASSGLMAYLDNAYIKADTVDARLVRAEEGIFKTLEAEYATIENLDAQYAHIETLDTDLANIGRLFADYAQINDANITNLQAETAKIQNLSATELTATVGYIHTLGSNEVTAESLVADHGAIAALGSNYAAIDFANVQTADISEAWIKNLMIQSQFVAQEGTIYKLQLLELDANRITAGVMSADHLQLRGNDGLYYQLNYDALGASKWEQLSPEEQNELKAHIHADTILAHSITSEQLTVNNIVGSGGWINLANGTFEYQNAATGNGITWDGQHLNINADSLSIGSRSVEEVIADSSVINRMPISYLYEVFYGKIFNDSDHGITWTVNQDGSVTAKGTARGVSRYFFSSYNLEDRVAVITLDPAKKYTVSGCPGGNGSTPNYWIGGRFYTEQQMSDSAEGTVFSDTGEGYTSDSGFKYAVIYAQVKDGFTTPQDGITFYPMLETGNAAHNYVSTHDGAAGLVDKISLAEAKIQVNSDSIELKVSKDGLISAINASPEAIQISSDKIYLDGQLAITSLTDAARKSIVKSTATRVQYYLSNSDTQAIGSTEGWVYSTDGMDWTPGRYIWTRIEITDTLADADATTAIRYSSVRGTYDKQLTDALANSASAQSTADTALTNAASAQSTADTALTNAASAQSTADTAIASTVSVYQRKSTSGAPDKPTASTSISATADNTNNVWTYLMPRPARGCNFYTCERYVHKNGTVSYSDVRALSNLTYTSMWCSANDATLIDGSYIATGTIDAGKINVTDLYAFKAKIAGWAINSSSITNGTIGESGSFHMGSGNLASAKIARNTRSDWRLAVGSNFGITSSGNLYAEGVTLYGEMSVKNTNGDIIFQVIGQDVANSQINLNGGLITVSGINLVTALTNRSGVASGVSATGVSGQSGHYYRYGNVVVLSFMLTASQALGSAEAVLSGLPKAYYTDSNYVPRTTFNSAAGGIGWGFVNDSGQLRVRVTAAGTYYGGIAYIAKP